MLRIAAAQTPPIARHDRSMMPVKSVCPDVPAGVSVCRPGMETSAGMEDNEVLSGIFVMPVNNFAHGLPRSAGGVAERESF
jgi:hypothetical protein